MNILIFLNHELFVSTLTIGISRNEQFVTRRRWHHWALLGQHKVP